MDLLVRTPSGLVVVDYKTEATPDAATMAERVAEYTDQVAAYGLLDEAVMREPVTGGCLVFCDEAGSQEVRIPSWPQALAAVRARLGVAPIGR